jgi:hypothetical protein
MSESSGIGQLGTKSGAKILGLKKKKKKKTFSGSKKLILEEFMNTIYKTSWSMGVGRVAVPSSSSV